MIARDDSGKFTKYAWPGGYPVYHLCADGGVLCADCANDPGNLAGADADTASDWRIVASDVNWEDGALQCDHCSKRIESAYGDE